MLLSGRYYLIFHLLTHPCWDLNFFDKSLGCPLSTLEQYSGAQGKSLKDFFSNALREGILSLCSTTFHYWSSLTSGPIGLWNNNLFFEELNCKIFCCCRSLVGAVSCVLVLQCRSSPILAETVSSSKVTPMMSSDPVMTRTQIANLASVVKVQY
jgi:hypothetical protein